MYNLTKSLLILFFLTCSNNTYSTDLLVKDSLNENEDYYIACKSFSTDHVRLNRISSAQQEIESYKAIYTDSGFRNDWFTDVPWMSLHEPNTLNEQDIASSKEECALLKKKFLFSTDHDSIQKSDIKYFQAKEDSGFYKLPMSFADYTIYDKQTKELVGRFVFKNIEKERRIEYGIYLLAKFRGKGLGGEIKSGVFKNMIDPALGKPFIISCCSNLDEPYYDPNDFETKIHPNFQGIFSKIAPWYNYPSLAVSHKAGCTLSWVKHIPTTFYPVGDKSSMSQNDVNNFKKVIKEFYLVSEELFKEKKEIDREHIGPEKFFSIMARSEEDSHKNQIIENLYKLWNTKDEATSTSTIGALVFMGEDMDSVIRTIFSKNREEEESEDINEEEISVINKKRSLSILDIEDSDAKARPSKSLISPALNFKACD